MASEKLSLKLLVNKTTQKIRFAEARKDFVDFLFTFLAKGAIKVFSKLHSHGCMTRLIESVENLDPFTPSFHGSNAKSTTTASNRYYYTCCSGSHGSFPKPCVTDVKGTICPHCNSAMTKEVEYVAAPALVKDARRYMVTDDLVVKPIDTFSYVALLNKLKEVGALEEKVVEVGMEEVLDLLMASCESETALNDVFLGKMAL